MSKNKKSKGKGKSKGKHKNIGRYYRGPNPTKEDDLTKYSGKLFQRYLDLGFQPDEVRKKIESLEECPIPPPELLNLLSASNCGSAQDTDTEFRLLKKYCRLNGIKQACRTYFFNKIEKGVEPERAMQQAIMFREVSACYKPISHDKLNLKDYCQRNRIYGHDRTTFMGLIKKGYKPNDALLELEGGGEQKQVEYKNLTWRRGMNTKNGRDDANMQPTSSNTLTSHSFPQNSNNCGRKINTGHPTSFTRSGLLGNSPQASPSSNSWSRAADRHPTNSPFSTSFTSGPNYDRREKDMLSVNSTFTPKFSPGASGWKKDTSMQSTSLTFPRENLFAPQPSTTGNGPFPNYVKVAVLPKRYPQTTLGEIELSMLENAILEEIGRGWEVNIQIRGINFKRDMLVIDCENPETVKWLLFVTPRLNAWKGVGLMARIEGASPGV